MSSLRSGLRGLFVSAILAVLPAGGPAFAQTDTGRIFGSVTDPSGAIVQGATITITDTERGTTRTLATNETGEYLAPNLMAGQYSV